MPNDYLSAFLGKDDEPEDDYLKAFRSSAPTRPQRSYAVKASDSSPIDQKIDDQKSLLSSAFWRGMGALAEVPAMAVTAQDKARQGFERLPSAAQGILRANPLGTSLIEAQLPEGLVSEAEQMGSNREKLQSMLLDAATQRGYSPVTAAAIDTFSENPDLLAGAGALARKGVRAATSLGDELGEAVGGGLRAFGRESGGVPLSTPTSPPVAAPAASGIEKMGVFQKWFAPEGRYSGAGKELAPRIQSVVDQKDIAVRYQQQVAHDNLRELDAAINRHVKQGAHKDEILDEIGLWLESDKPKGPYDTGLPEDIAGPTMRFRDHLDTRSRDYIDEPGLLSDEMKEVFGGNEGKYLRRTYRRDYDPRFAPMIREGEGVPGSTWERMREFVSDNDPNLNPDEVKGYMESLLDRDPEAFAVGGGGIGRKDLTGLIHRKEIPDPVAEFIGRESDPRIRYVEAISRMAMDLETHKMLKQVREIGEGKIFFDKPTGDAIRQIPGGDSRNPLSELFANPELQQQFMGALNVQSGPKSLPKKVMDGYMALVGWGKGALTVLNIPQSHIRNLLAWGPISLATGNNPLNARRFGRSFAAVGAQVSPKKFLSKIPDRYKDLYAEAVRYGVAGESVTAGDVGQYVSGMGAPFQAKTKVGKVAEYAGRGSRAFLKGAGKWYGHGDDLGKLAVWEGEMVKYRKAFPDMPEEELKRITAENVRSITPTWSKTGIAADVLRANPAVGPFPTFWMEMWRSTGSNLKLAMSEMKSGNPELAKIGAKRIAGTISALAIPTATGIAFKNRLGVTPEEENGFLEHVAEWDRDSDLVMTSRKDGKIQYFNTSFMDPYSAMKDPVLGVLREGRLDEATWMSMAKRGLGRALDPFLGEEPLTGAVLDVVRNRKPTGATVYNPAIPKEKFPKSVEHIARPLTPGIINKGNKIVKGLRGETSRYGQEYPVGQTVVSIFGPRVETLDLRQSLFHRSGDAARTFSNLKSYWSGEFKSMETGADPDSRRLYVEELWQNRDYPQLMRLVSGAIDNSLPEKDAREILSDKGFSKTVIKALLDRNPVAPPIISDRSLQYQMEKRDFRQKMFGGVER